MSKQTITTSDGDDWMVPRRTPPLATQVRDESGVTYDSYVGSGVAGFYVRDAEGNRLGWIYLRPSSIDVVDPLQSNASVYWCEDDWPEPATDRLLRRYVVPPAVDGEAPEIVEEIVRWLQHADRLDEILGAKMGLPERNVLWDAADAIRRRFGSNKAVPDRRRSWADELIARDDKQGPRSCAGCSTTTTSATAGPTTSGGCTSSMTPSTL